MSCSICPRLKKILEIALMVTEAKLRLVESTRLGTKHKRRVLREVKQNTIITIVGNSNRFVSILVIAKFIVVGFTS